jgi:hypothetical protein
MRPDTLHFSGQIDLTQLFLHAWPLVDPTLAENALAEIPHSGAGLPRERAREEAVRWIWEEDLSVIDTSTLEVWRLPPDGRMEGAQRLSFPPWSFDGPEIQAYLRALPGAYSPISHGRLMLEVRVHRVLAWIADAVRCGALSMTATHPQTHQPFEPDPILIEGLFGSSRRGAGQISTDAGTIRKLRFICNTDPAQGKPVPQPGAGSPPSQQRLRMRKPRGAGELAVVLAKMRTDGLATVEALNYSARGAHYNTSDRTADRALRQLREETANPPPQK